MIYKEARHKKPRQISLLLLLILLSYPSISQNLVPNASFEEFIDFNIVKTSGWHKVQISDSPDYFNVGINSSFNNIFGKYTGGTIPKTGNGFVGLFCFRVHKEREIKNVREYIETDLLDSLQKDSIYIVEISLCLDEESNSAIKDFGLLFTKHSLEYNKDYKLFTAKPQVEFTFSSPDCRNNWISFSSFYKASGAEKCIIIGNFKSDRATSIHKLEIVKDKNRERKWKLDRTESAAYYYIDDVVIEKVTLINKAKPDVKESVEITGDSLNIEKIEIDSAIVLKNIYFEFNKSDLLPQSYFEINKLYRLMINNPSVRIKLEGHTDNIGGYGFNLQLSVRRAESVVRYLIEQGINPDRLEFAGFSYTFPLASNETAEGREENRRVVFKIIEK